MERTRNSNTKIARVDSFEIGKTLYTVIKRIGEFVIAQKADDIECVFHQAEGNSTPKAIKIDGKPVIKAFFPRNYDFVVLETSQTFHFRSLKNEEIDEENWRDYYFEPYTESIYRAREDGAWYDIEGYKLESNVFLKLDVLCSLDCKKSLQSWSFSKQRLFTSKHFELFQIGKVVWSKALETVDFAGEKITSIGPKNIAFSKKEDVIQEVSIGLAKNRFINEFSKAPYLLGGDEVVAHVGSKNIGNLRFEVFETESKRYTVEGHSLNVLAVNGEAVDVDFDSYIELGGRKLLKIKANELWYYIDLLTRRPFLVDEISKERIIEINDKIISINRLRCVNMKSERSSFVFDLSNQRILKLDNAAFQPEVLQDVDDFTSVLCYAMKGDLTQLMIKKKLEIVELEGGYDVSDIKGKKSDKLVILVDKDGGQRALDLRYGIENIGTAICEGQEIVDVIGNAVKVGSFVLQNVVLTTLGGEEEAVVDLNCEVLEKFKFPHNLQSYAEQELKSNFAGSELVQIDFDDKVQIGEKSYFKGSFRSFLGQNHECVLDADSGRPFQLEGLGNKYELLTSLDNYYFENEFFIGKHRMIGCQTLTEDNKLRQLLFSEKTFESWIPFHDSYLPVMKKFVILDSEADWEYHLIELQGITEEKDYIAVEKHPPHRILIKNIQGKYLPKIVKSKNKLLRTPEEISIIKKFFLNDPGVLVELE